jgi:hypothetical protein
MIDGLSEIDFKSVTDKAKPIDNDSLKGFKAYAKKLLRPHIYEGRYVC